MPLQPDAPQVIGTYDIAYARLMQMERKFARDPALREKYTKFMRDYEELNHMSRVPVQKHHSDTAIYIPHHAAGTEKFRTVFDGSAKAENGISINDIQLNGEKVQPELITTLMRFRTHRVALTADVSKMYRQILIAEDQRDMQRILWRESTDEPVREYWLNTQTYGNKSAAYVSIRTMDYMADEFATEFPAASRAVKTSFYVDDALSGSHDVESAIGLHRELIEMFGRRKMELAKWNTNDPVMRKHIKSSGCQLIELNKEETTAVLGMHWDANEDTFQYIIKNPIRLENATKRSISSDIARLYDPCGYLSCVVIFAKVVLKDLWIDKLDWDDTVEGEPLERWKQFAMELPNITAVRIPRWINTDLKSKKQLHAFADASQTGYGTKFYLRQQRDDEPVTVHLVFAKARVAPVKGSTIPKLELTACHLTAQLLEGTIREAAPSAPHMGGLHEAAVKSAKSHLKRVIGGQQLTFEQLATLLTQVEACLNSRPLIALSDDATDDLALTPGHFLVGEPLVASLSRDYTTTAANRLRNFELMTKMTQEFWQRWSH
ncbi:uncharacterized protein LOC129571937, partial [Sitodiplosis mosellana]|uniref:uncharacterized protein LOC129571937 n=1 Tax=Sitodiplosis mosellana TaxID=263140 RepID=UPI0024438557